MDRLCKECGKVFKAKRSNAVRCDKCIAKGKKEDKQTCKWCGKSGHFGKSNACTDCRTIRDSRDKILNLLDGKYGIDKLDYFYGFNISVMATVTDVSKVDILKAILRVLAKRAFCYDEKVLNIYLSQKEEDMMPPNIIYFGYNLLSHGKNVPEDNGFPYSIFKLYHDNGIKLDFKLCKMGVDFFERWF